MARPLFHLEKMVFYPAGAPAIEIRFSEQANRRFMIIRDGTTVLTGSREHAER